jgi:thioredoxin reductase
MVAEGKGILAADESMNTVEMGRKGLNFAQLGSVGYAALMVYDSLIIGLGCAGYTAAIYNARYRLKTFIVGVEDGGMGLTAAEVGNWPGEIEITGPDLMEKFKKHALSFEEVTHKTAWVKELKKVGGIFQMSLDSGEVIEGKTVILATGSSKRHLGVPGEQEFSGKGVTYCATCDAFFYKGKDVAVIGGGDSAVEGAAIAAQVARKVYLVHRRKDFRAEPFWVERVKARDNVTMVLEAEVAAALSPTIASNDPSQGPNKTPAITDTPAEGNGMTLDAVAKVKRTNGPQAPAD